MIGVSAVPTTQQKASCFVNIFTTGITIRNAELLRFFPQTSYTVSTGHIFSLSIPTKISPNNVAIMITPNK